MEDSDWEQLLEMRLVMPAELESWRNLGSEQRLYTIVDKAGRVAKHSFSFERALDLYSVSLAPLNVIRQQLDTIMHQIHAPIPFTYFHMLQLCLSVSLVALAYGFARVGSFIAPAIFVVMTCTFMGMMEIASNLSNPFGSDTQDYPLRQFMAEAKDSLGMLIGYEHDGAADEWVKELNLAGARPLRLDVDPLAVLDFLNGDLPDTSENEKQGVLPRRRLAIKQQHQQKQQQQQPFMPDRNLSSFSISSRTSTSTRALSRSGQRTLHANALGR